ncbi:hypothetical protein N8K70_03845 [Microbacterium betulae]|uniref:Uncharacterized protein n=1 Tax=Microbacterium betulae TaxID=2981139 RepID=A0AA97FJD0_9MICO|nr:hypothetical protein [Microbacterium sp. AB]WOF23823.1 hypothetical protein N8K70_03845 [Microbacterium sp. AB]
MKMPQREAERFISDLQDHIESVTTFYVSQDELRDIIRGLRADGHVDLPDLENAS